MPVPSRNARFTEDVLRERGDPASTKPSASLPFVVASRFLDGHFALIAKLPGITTPHPVRLEPVRNRVYTVSEKPATGF
jgi:hypothetical protein